MSQDSANKLAVVTGGASGIGLETCMMLGERGYTLAISDVNVEGAKSTAKSIVEAGGSAEAFYVDLADTDSVTALRRDVVTSLGIPSLVANVAGWDVPGPFLKGTDEYQRKVIDINLMGPIKLTHEFLNVMVPAGNPGRVVSVASDAGRVGTAGQTLYSAAKGGIIAFTKAIALEMARYQITANCVCPGPTDTPFLQEQLSDEVKAALVRATPLRRLAHPREIATAIAFFASDEAEFITGQVLSVSGGITMCD